MGQGFFNYDDWRRFKNHYIMSMPQEEFDKYCDQIEPDKDTSFYNGDEDIDA